MRRGTRAETTSTLFVVTILTASSFLVEPKAAPSAPPVDTAEKAVPPGKKEAADAPEDCYLGKTQPAPGRIAKIAPVPFHPVEEVKVVVGSTVKKDQVLVKLDSDEPEAELRSKKAVLTEMEASLARLQEEPRDEEQKEARANLESAHVCAREARELLDRLEPAYRTGAVSEQKYLEIRALVLRCQSDERAALARLDKLLKRPFKREVAEIEARIAAARENIKASEAELEHYTLKSPIDGVVASLTVVLGEVRGHETTVWGEILDLKQLDVRCDLPPSQLDGIRVGSEAQVMLPGRNTAVKGKVVNVGVAADRVSGNIPVLIRVDNADEQLRCYIEVKVRFGTTAQRSEGR